jgi:CelD/BcsL family acetyltransferase involved in cellulose biosynthesis
MARHQNHNETEVAAEVLPVETAAVAEVAAEAVEAAPAVDERYKKISVDAEAATFAGLDGSKVGETLNRIDFIRSAWTVGKKSRGDIARELTRLAGKKVTYQIVFSATKGVDGGPDAPAPVAEGSQEAPASE